MTIPSEDTRQDHQHSDSEQVPAVTPWHPSATVRDQEFFDQLADNVGPAIVREMLNLGKTEHAAAMAARAVVSDSYRAVFSHVLDAAEARVRSARAETIEACAKVAENYRIIDRPWPTIYVAIANEIRALAPDESPSTEERKTGTGKLVP